MNIDGHLDIVRKHLKMHADLDLVEYMQQPVMAVYTVEILD